MHLSVLTAAQAGARDRAAIDAGTPSVELMRRAGERAAHVVWERFPDECARGVAVFVGGGNNGGDGWVLAAELQRLGAPVGVEVVAEPTTNDARWARSTLTSPAPPPASRPGVVVDALLGTGARGAPRHPVAKAIERVNQLRGDGAVVASLDIPSGLDASTGEASLAVTADLTLAFGHWKRGQLRRRDLCGALVLLDIGLPEEQGADGAPRLVDAPMVRAWTPAIGALAHKGSRKRILIVGSPLGMAGASVLAARAAMRSGVGMVRFCAHPVSIPALQAACPEAVALPWPDAGPGEAELVWPHALLLGPGFGLDAGARLRASSWLTAWRGPVVVDADVFTLFAADPSALGALLRSRPAVATPHAAEGARLLGCPVDDVIADPYLAAQRLATLLEAVVLLKGVPTLVATPRGDTWVVPRGTAALATGGSGDLLAGIVTTLLAQGGDPVPAATCGAWVHGRSAEIANTGRPVRGVTLGDVTGALAHAWRLDDEALAPHELSRLPALSGTGGA